MKDAISYPRAPGKWSLTLLFLEQAWQRGDETEMLAGEFYVPKQLRDFTKCPVCRQSYHTGKHTETARVL